jgi:hypothetical protein
MTTGTKSVLFGAHCFFIHPWFVWLAHWKLYGWEALDPRVIVACVVHDWGYAGCHSMDDEVGETHPIVGAKIMGWLFDWGCEYSSIPLEVGWNNKIPQGWTWDRDRVLDKRISIKRKSVRWYNFALLHSRYYSKRLGLPFSRLCVSDKYSFVLTPWWIYIPCVLMAGEWREYLHNGRKAEAVPGAENYEAVKKIHQGALTEDLRLWHTGLSEYMAIWVKNNKGCHGIDETAVRR